MIAFKSISHAFGPDSCHSSLDVFLFIVSKTLDGILKFFCESDAQSCTSVPGNGVADVIEVSDGVEADHFVFLLMFLLHTSSLDTHIIGVGVL